MLRIDHKIETDLHFSVEKNDRQYNIIVRMDNVYQSTLGSPDEIEVYTSSRTRKDGATTINIHANLVAAKYYLYDEFECESGEITEEDIDEIFSFVMSTIYPNQ